MRDSEENVPDLTKILFILHILDDKNKANLAVDNSKFYDLIKRLKERGTKFGYIKYYEDKEDGALVNDLLDRDLSILQEKQNIEITPGNTISITDDGKELVKLAISHYNGTYTRLQDLMLTIE